MSDNAIHCPECQKEDKQLKMGVIQGAAFIHENVVCYWRRRKCRRCGFTAKTVEAPADTLHLFLHEPQSKEMS